MVRESALKALEKYENTLSAVIRESSESIAKEGISKFLETSFLTFTTGYGCLEEICRSLNCSTPDELEKGLEGLSMQSGSHSEDEDVIEGYFRATTEWSNFLKHCDDLLDVESSEFTKQCGERNVLEFQLERLSSEPSSGNENVSVAEILSKRPLTWMVFIRHFS